MADNKTLPAVGTGTADIVVATDEVAGVDYQYIKLVDGTANSTAVIPGGASGLKVDGSGVTQPVSAASLPLPAGAATAANQLPDGHNVTVDNAAGAAAVNVQDGGNSLTVDGTVTANLASGTNNIGDVDVLTVPAPLSTTGGGTEATALRVTVANDSTGVLSVDDNGASLTVDGSVSLAAAIPAGTNNIGDVDVLTLPALVAGTANIGDVDVLTVPAPLSTTGGGTEATAHRVTIANDSTGVLSVDDNGGSLTIDGSVGLNAGTNNIGDVDVLTLPALVAGTANIGDVDIASAPTGTSAIAVQGHVAHDAAITGNPFVHAGTHETPADSAPTNRLATVTDGDVQRFSTVDGALFVVTSGPQQWKARLTGAMTDTTVKAAPGAGLSLYITDVIYSIGAATASSLLLEESTTTAVCGPHYLEAINGRGFAFHFTTPIKIAANTLLSATNTGSTTATLDVYGFTAPG